MATIGQVRRIIRLDKKAKRRKYEFDHRTRTQIIDDYDKDSRKTVKKQIVHFPVKIQE